MGLADIVRAVVPGIQTIIGGDGGLLVQTQVTYGADRPYNPADGTFGVNGGQVITTQALRYKQKANQTQGIRVNHHPTDGIMNYVEMVMFFLNDFPAATMLKKKDIVEVIGVDGATLETWQINEIDPDPTQSIVICSLERS